MWKGLGTSVIRVLKHTRFIDRAVLVGTLILVGIICYSLGQYHATGLFPFEKVEVLGVGPEVQTEITAQDVEAFVESDQVDLQEYGEGFNCMEYGVLLARQAQWEGLPSVTIGVRFEDGEAGHILLAFPTEDEGWIFIEPSTDTQVYPRPGGYLERSPGRKISGLYAMVTEWVPFWVPEVNE